MTKLSFLIECQVKYENGTVMCVAEGWEGQYKKCVKQTCVVEGNRWKLKLDIGKVIF